MSDRRGRAEELLHDRALHGLSMEERSELQSLLDGADDLSFDVAVAAADVATIRPDEPLPAHLVARIEADALRLLPVVAPPTSVLRLRQRSQPRAPTIALFAGGIAAAAGLALAATSWLSRPARPTASIVQSSPPPPTPRAEPPTPATPPGPAELRDQLLAARDAVHVAWSATKDPSSRGATGDVVWSSDAQRGYMRFHGLAANDAKTSQYQLWIFDPSQSEKTPIDGGVFDVEASSGDVLVPITPKLHVTRPTLFAVTIEKPGGVVVSKRKRIVTLAAVKG